MIAMGQKMTEPFLFGISVGINITIFIPLFHKQRFPYGE